MTLGDVTILVGKLVGTLQSRGPSTTDQDLAEEYAEACVRVNERLAQCSRMIDEGSAVQALMLAEEKPNLLDAVAALSFAQSGEWHEACTLSGLRQAPKIDRAAVQKVNELYNKGNKTEQTKVLYKQFRAAMAARDDAKALDAVRAIVSLDPADLDAAKEYARLERKRGEDLLQALGGALSKGNREEVLALLDQCQKLGLHEGPELDRALAVQRQLFTENAKEEVARIIPSLTELQAEGRWQQCAERANRVNTLSATYGLDLPADDVAAVASAIAYCDSCRQESMQKARFKEAVSALSECADRIKVGEKTTSRKSLEELEQQRLGLKKCYEKAREFILPIPEELVSKVGQIANDLDGEIERLTKGRKIRNVALAAGLALSLLGVILVGYFVVRAGQLSGELRGLVAEAKAMPLRELTAEVKNKHSAYLSVPYLKTALLEADAWLAGVEAQARAAESAIARANELAEQGFSGVTPDEASVAFQQATDSLNQLPKDVADTMRPKLSDAQSRLSIWLTTTRDARVMAAKTKIQQAREFGSKVDAATTGEDLREAVAPFAKAMEELLEATESQVEQIRLPESLKAEIAELVARQETASDLLASYESAIRELSAAASIEEYSAGIQKLAAVQLPRSPAIKAAQLLATKKIDAHQFLGSMILPDNPDAWVAIKGPAELASTPQPDQTRDSEVERLRQLINAENIAGVHEAILQDRDGPPSSYSGRKIFIRGKMEVSQPGDGITRATGTVYDPARSGGKLDFEEKTFEHVYTASTQMQRGQRVEKQKETDASAALKKFGLEALVSPDGSKYRQNILEVIDKVRSSKNVPPLVKAFVIQELAAIAKARPNVWGLPWVPAFEAEIEEMNKLAGGKVGSGDWMVPAKAEVGKLLAGWFEDHEDFSLVTQMSINRQLAKAALEAGLIVCGYIGPDGNLVETKKDFIAGSTELWGLGSKDGLPVVAFTRSGGSLEQPLQSTGAALFLSPVFCLPLRPADTIKAVFTGAQVSDDMAPRYLSGTPPLFSAEASAKSKPANE